MSVILDKYKFSFHKLDLKNNITGINSVISVFKSSVHERYIVSDFFGDYRKSVDVQINIIDIITDVMNGVIEEGETGSQSGVDVYIKSDFTKFVGFSYSGTYLEPDFVMSTADFKQLSIEWKQFLDS